jgi:DNA repair ATPase RecN
MGTWRHLGMLTEIMEPLLNISRRSYEHQELLRPRNHIDILDSFGGLLACGRTIKNVSSFGSGSNRE